MLLGAGVQGSTQGHWRFPSNGLEQGYCYLLTHAGTPCIFYDHLEDPQLANAIQRLIALRLRAGIHCRSQARPQAWCSWSVLVNLRRLIDGLAREDRLRWKSNNKHTITDGQC